MHQTKRRLSLAGEIIIGCPRTFYPLCIFQKLGFKSVVCLSVPIDRKKLRISLEDGGNRHVGC